MTAIPPRRERRSRIPRPWPARAALVFVLLTMAALITVPLLVQRRVNTLRRAIAAAEPARTVLTRLQFNLVREMWSLSEVLLGGDARYSLSYTQARENERAILRELEPLTAQLGPAVETGFERVRALTRRWHELAAAEEIVSRKEAEEELGELPREQGLFEEVIRASVALDSLIVQESAANRARIRAAERSGMALTVMLGVLALLAAAVVAALEARVRRAAAEAERRREEAEAALAGRERLIRGITHDVKNPLGAAKGYAELLAMEIKAPLHPEQAPLVGGIVRSVDGALAIIADLLDVARADSGGLTVQRETADLAAVARAAVEDHRAAAEAAGHSLEFRAAEEPLVIHTDPARVQQVLGNLLSNAIKYTPAPGRIEVVTGLDPDDGAAGGGVRASVRVIDSGPGVPPEKREAIFDEFTRLDERSGMKGHGLGLAIARRIARLLGGDLHVDDAPGGGACFVLWLPQRGDDALPLRRSAR